MADDAPCIWVLSGTNGSGKSSIGGAMLRQLGGDYFNPDEVALSIRERQPGLTQQEVNGQAWALGVSLLEDAIRLGHDYFFETTLGGKTVVARLQQALHAGHQVRIWYVGLSHVEQNIARVAARVRAGGHDIPEQDIRRRYERSLRNLIVLLPYLTELRVYDNSVEADPARDKAPKPKLVLHCREGVILGPGNLQSTPDWAKPIVAQALKTTLG